MMAGLGTSRAEIVLRGGYLAKPEVVEGILEVNGKQFWRLSKLDSQLNKFLTPKSLCKQPLVDTSVIERIMHKRNDEWYKQLEIAGQDGGFEPEMKHAACDDNLDALNLDAPPTTPKKEASCRARKSPKGASKSLRHLMPRVATIELERMIGSETPWSLSVLLEEPRRQSPAIEVTTENLQTLLDEVEYEINLDDDAEQKPKRRRTRHEGGLAPCGEPGRRQYFTPSKGGFVQTVKTATARKYATKRTPMKKRGRPAKETPDIDSDVENSPAV